MTMVAEDPRAGVGRRDIEPVVVGKVIGAFGVRGWIRIRPYTEQREGILAFDSWLAKRGGSWRPLRVVAGHAHGSGVVAAVEGVTDRDAAEDLAGTELAVDFDALPPAGQGEYYWAELEGLTVLNLGGEVLGKVTGLMATGANDVLIVDGDRQRLIPYIDSVVVAVDLGAGTLRVDWEADF